MASSRRVRRAKANQVVGYRIDLSTGQRVAIVRQPPTRGLVRVSVPVPSKWSFNGIDIRIFGLDFDPQIAALA